MATRGVQRSMELFLAFPFNNVLHRHVATLVTAVDKCSPCLAQFLLHDCGLLGWLVDAPTQVSTQPCFFSCLRALLCTVAATAGGFDQFHGHAAPMQVTPTPRPGDEHAEKRRPLRAGYVGHLTQVSNRLLQLASEGHQQVGCRVRGGVRSKQPATACACLRPPFLCRHLPAARSPMLALTPPACSACSCMPPWRATRAGRRM